MTFGVVANAFFAIFDCRMIVLTLLIASALAASFSDAVYQDKFVAFMREHQKSYNHDEFEMRFAKFRANVDFIEEHNKGNHGYTVKMNQFGDLDSKEFGRIYNGYRQKAKPNVAAAEWPLAEVDVSALPTTVDWRTKGAVTSVKNQGQCGSCWSFSTTGSVEGQHFLSGQGALVGLSEQNLMDCSTAQGNMGCDGGLMDDAFQYIILNKGIELEADYPYTAEDGNSCKYKVADRGACIQKYQDVPTGNETALQVAVATVGPVSVAIDASQSSFQFYESGVYYSYFCSSTQLDHGVLAVGYGTDNNGLFGPEKYWLVKNSWGASWGDNGFIKMIRDWDNNCGIATAASYPIITSKTC